MFGTTHKTTPDTHSGSPATPAAGDPESATSVRLTRRGALIHRPAPDEAAAVTLANRRAPRKPPRKRHGRPESVPESRPETRAKGRVATLAARLTVPAVLALAAVAGDAAVNSGPAAAAAIKFRKLEVKNLDRQRPIMIVRLLNGRWQAHRSDKVRFNLKLFAHVKRQRMKVFQFKTEAKHFRLWAGKLTWKLRAKRLVFSLTNGELGDGSRRALARFCGQNMRGRTGTRDFNGNLTLQFIASSATGKIATRYVTIPSKIRCIS